MNLSVSYWNSLVIPGMTQASSAAVTREVPAPRGDLRRSRVVLDAICRIFDDAAGSVDEAVVLSAARRCGTAMVQLSPRALALEFAAPMESPISWRPPPVAVGGSSRVAGLILEGLRCAR